MVFKTMKVLINYVLYLTIDFFLNLHYRSAKNVINSGLSGCLLGNVLLSVLLSVNVNKAIIAINRVGGKSINKSSLNWCKYQRDDQSYFKYCHTRISLETTTKERFSQDQYQRTINF